MKKLDELVLVAEGLGLSPKKKVLKNGKEKHVKSEVIKALKNHYLSVIYDGKAPKHVEFINGMESVMLAERHTSFDTEIINDVKKTSKYIYQRKFSGVRGLLFWSRESGKFEVFGRDRNDENFLFVQYGNKIEFQGNSGEINKKLNSFLVDCEMVVGGSTEVDYQMSNINVILEAPEDTAKELQSDSKVKFIIFDCLMINGEYITTSPLSERLKFAEGVQVSLASTGFNCEFPESVTDPSLKDSFYSKAVEEGYSGVVAKRLDSIYVIDGSRGPEWVKIKRSTSDTLVNNNLGDNIDGYIVGFSYGEEGSKLEGRIANLKVAVLVNESEGHQFEQIIAEVPISDQLREVMETDDRVNGVRTLKEEYKKMTVSLDGQHFLRGRLQHPKLIRLRPDKFHGDCTLDRSIIEGLTLGSIII